MFFSGFKIKIKLFTYFECQINYMYALKTLSSPTYDYYELCTTTKSTLRKSFTPFGAQDYSDWLKHSDRSHFFQQLAGNLNSKILTN